ncbi:MAG: glycosyltransferase family 2 protein [Lachnospiraceae bacterium]|nr:glycosyltransferase family 2 protein [Lachnospiraceae bacterium]
MDKLYIVIPAYNEEATINQVIDDWYPVVEKIGEESRLVIIDDGSKDHTYEQLESAAKTRPQLVAMTKPNGGHGATILFGYDFAVNQGADYIFQTDSDGQTLPAEFPPFWKERKNYEMIVGHRNHRKDGASRVFVTKVLKLVIRLCFHVDVVDANTPYRLMETKTLKEQLKLIPNDFFLTNVLINVIYTKKCLNVKYVPITFRPRQGGVNSINMRRIIKIGKQAFKDFRKLNKELE